MTPPIRRQARLIGAMLKSGVPGDRIRTVVSPHGKRSEWFWAREFQPAYRWLFSHA